MRAIDADAVPQEFWEYEFDGKWRGCTIKDLLDSQPTIQPDNNSENPNGSDVISRRAAIDALKDWYDGMIISSFRGIEKVIDALPPVQPETAKRIVGKSRDGMTLWYQCDMCNEPVDAQDNYCRGCGRRLIDG